MTSRPQSRAAALVGHLQALVEREDRGALAALRRGLGKEPGTTPEMYRHVEPYLGDARRTQADAAYLVASLFGLHPVPWKPPGNPPRNTSFGWSLSSIRLRQDGSEDEALARRFVAALSCGSEALPTHLRHLFGLLRSRGENAPVNWERLFWDIVFWERIDRRAQRRWAEGFWRGAGGDTARQEDAGADDEPPHGEQPDN